MKNLFLNWAWSQIKPDIKQWLTARVLQLPAAKEQVYAQDIAQRFGLKNADGTPDVAQALSILKDIENTLQSMAATAVDSFLL